MKAVVLAIFIFVASAAVALPVGKEELTEDDQKLLQASVKEYQDGMKKCVEKECGSKAEDLNKIMNPTYGLDKNVSVVCLENCFSKHHEPLMSIHERILKNTKHYGRFEEVKKAVRDVKALFKQRKKVEAAA